MIKNLPILFISLILFFISLKLYTPSSNIFVFRKQLCLLRTATPQPTEGVLGFLKGSPRTPPGDHNRKDTELLKATEFHYYNKSYNNKKEDNKEIKLIKEFVETLYKEMIEERKKRKY